MKARPSSLIFRYGIQPDIRRKGCNVICITYLADKYLYFLLTGRNDVLASSNAWSQVNYNFTASVVNVLMIDQGGDIFAGTTEGEFFSEGEGDSWE